MLQSDYPTQNIIQLKHPTDSLLNDYYKMIILPNDYRTKWSSYNQNILQLEHPNDS